MKRKLSLVLIVTQVFFGITAEANATSDSRADCVATSYTSYFPLGYDPGLGKYMTEAERSGLPPAVEVNISYGRLCNYRVNEIELKQFEFSLRINGYKNGYTIPLLKSIDLGPFGGSLKFSVPGITPGSYTGTLLVRDLIAVNSIRREIKLDYLITVYGEAKASPSPTPTVIPEFRSLYNTETVWIVGYQAKVYSCWNQQIKGLKLQAKVLGKWSSKASAKFVKDKTLCTGKYPWAAKYVWNVDEYGDRSRPGSRGRDLMVREFANGLKSFSTVSRIVYASNDDRIEDGLDVLDELLNP